MIACNTCHEPTPENAIMPDTGDCVTCVRKRIKATESQTPSGQMNLLVSCPFCGEKMKPFKSGMGRYGLIHRCPDGLQITTGLGRKKDVVQMVSKRSS